MTDAHPRTSRLVEVDALRGIAAIAVVLFHYTTAFNERFAPFAMADVRFPHGHLGVNLFFIISGFVIFLTLNRTRRPADFIVSRFSRLFPAYWVAILLTFTITHAMGLPEKLLVDWPDALANFTMLHNIFRIPHVDGVYWTLEVELLFYAGMFTLYLLNKLDHIHLALIAMMALRLTYFAFERIAGIDLPWTLMRLLILDYLPWFALGIAVYLWVYHADAPTRRRAALVAGSAVLTLTIVKSVWLGGLACGMALLVLAAANGRLAFLRLQPIIWLGSVSYPLYLLHENIGWSLQLRLLAWSNSPNLSLLMTLLAALGLAAAIGRWIERPAMRQIRAVYKRWQAER